MTTYTYTIGNTKYAIEKRDGIWKLFQVDDDNGYGIEEYEWIESFDLKRDALAYLNNK